MEPANSPTEIILIVDDDPAIISVMTRILGRVGYQILSAPDGLKCIEITKEVKPDVILLDISMPHMNGIEVCTILKKDPATQDIPVIFVTGLANERTLRGAFNCGGTDYVSKPVNRVELLARIKSVLSHQALNRIRLEREKLIGVLEMAGAVCDKLNQPLQAISMNLELMTKASAGDTNTGRYIQNIGKQVERMGGIMRKLMRITRYETVDYLRGHKIIDIDKASGE